MGVDELAGAELSRGMCRQANLFFRLEQDDVRQGRLHRVADAACAIGAGTIGCA